MKLLKLKKLSNQKYRLELEYGVKCTTYDEIILKYNLLYKKEIDSELYEKMIRDTEHYDHFYKALKQINTKLRSEYEMTKYLEKLELGKEEQSCIINDLKEKGFLNDHRYLKAFVSDRVHLSQDGPRKIKEELLKQQINEEEIDDVLYSYDDSVWMEKIKAKVLKRQAANRTNSNFLFEQKLKRELLELGYDLEQIETVLSSICLINHTIDKEGLKIVKRLEKKKLGDKLWYQVKQKLYQKGYSQDEINQFMEQNKNC